MIVIHLQFVTNSQRLSVKFLFFFLLTAELPYFADYKSHRSISRTGHFRSFFFGFKSQIRRIGV